MTNLNIKLCQLNSIVGDVEANFDKISLHFSEALAENVDLLVFPELFLTGYPPEDLVLNKSFLHKTEDFINKAALLTKGTRVKILLSAPIIKNDKIYNSAIYLSEGKVIANIPKIHLPNYSVFDEKRIFTAGEFSQPIDINGIKVGIMTCEDAWYSDVSESLKNNGAEILISVNASPYEMGKVEKRIDVVSNRVKEVDLPFIYLNLVGGQDELVFDGASFIMSRNGTLLTKLASCIEQTSNVEVKRKNSELILNVPGSTTTNNVQDSIAEIYNVLVLGLRDYVLKSGFKKVVLGLSGGVDSALTAVIAVDALGAENVRCIRLPSAFSSDHSLKDAEDLAKLLDCKMDTLPIENIYQSCMAQLSTIFINTKRDLTEENLQARIRGVLLMATSNKFGELLLTTGNKSEVAVGYCTLYGDMCGGFSVLKDIYKTTVYKLCNWRNENWIEGFMGANSKVIPQNIIKKEPSAELRENQKDSDSLPEYDVLDVILKNLIEEDKSVQETAGDQFDINLVRKIKTLLYSSEYKRRQSSPGVKISSRDLAKDRRYPIVNGFKE